MTHPVIPTRPLCLAVRQLRALWPHSLTWLKMSSQRTGTPSVGSNHHGPTQVRKVVHIVLMVQRFCFVTFAYRSSFFCHSIHQNIHKYCHGYCNVYSETDTTHWNRTLKTEIFSIWLLIFLASLLTFARCHCGACSGSGYPDNGAVGQHSSVNSPEEKPVLQGGVIWLSRLE